jgi:hypothetical protein
MWWGLVGLERSRIGGKVRSSGSEGGGGWGRVVWKRVQVGWTRGG